MVIKLSIQERIEVIRLRKGGACHQRHRSNYGAIVVGGGDGSSAHTGDQAVALDALAVAAVDDRPRGDQSRLGPWGDPVCHRCHHRTGGFNGEVRGLGAKRPPSQSTGNQRRLRSNLPEARTIAPCPVLCPLLIWPHVALEGQPEQPKGLLPMPSESQ